MFRYPSLTRGLPKRLFPYSLYSTCPRQSIPWHSFQLIKPIVFIFHIVNFFLSQKCYIYFYSSWCLRVLCVKSLLRFLSLMTIFYRIHFLLLLLGYFAFVQVPITPFCLRDFLRTASINTCLRKLATSQLIKPQPELT